MSEINRQELNNKSIKLTIKENNLEIARANIYLIYNNLHNKPYSLLEDVFVNELFRGKGYGEMNISDGECAAIAYLDMNFGKMSKEKKEQTRKDLLAYCELDTEAMVWIVEELRKAVE